MQQTIPRWLLFVLNMKRGRPIGREPRSGYKKLETTYVASTLWPGILCNTSSPYGLYLFQGWRKSLKRARTTARTQRIFCTSCMTLTFDTFSWNGARHITQLRVVLHQNMEPPKGKYPYNLELWLFYLKIVTLKLRDTASLGLHLCKILSGPIS